MGGAGVQCSADDRSVEFLALRKIPLRKQAYIEAEDGDDTEQAGESSTTNAKSEWSVDPAALELQRTVQDVVLEDRDLADKVSTSHGRDFMWLITSLSFRPPRRSSPPSEHTRNTKPPTFSVCATSTSLAWARVSACFGCRECPRFGIGRIVWPRLGRGGKRARRWMRMNG